MGGFPRESGAGLTEGRTDVQSPAFHTCSEGWLRPARPLGQGHLSRCPVGPSGTVPAHLHSPSLFRPMHLADAQGMSQQKAVTQPSVGPDPQHLQCPGHGCSADPLPPPGPGLNRQQETSQPRALPHLQGTVPGLTWASGLPLRVRLSETCPWDPLAGGVHPHVLEGVGLSAGRSRMLSQLLTRHLLGPQEISSHSLCFCRPTGKEGRHRWPPCSMEHCEGSGDHAHESLGTAKRPRCQPIPQQRALSIATHPPPPPGKRALDWVFFPSPRQEDREEGPAKWSVNSEECPSLCELVSRLSCCWLPKVPMTQVPHTHLCPAQPPGPGGWCTGWGRGRRDATLTGTMPNGLGMLSLKMVPQDQNHLSTPGYG